VTPTLSYLDRKSRTGEEIRVWGKRKAFQSILARRRDHLRDNLQNRISPDRGWERSERRADAVGKIKVSKNDLCVMKERVTVELPGRPRYLAVS